MKTRTGAALAVGDLLLFLGQAHRIVRFEPYEHPWFAGVPARIAVCELGWGITAFDDATFEIAA